MKQLVIHLRDKDSGLAYCGRYVLSGNIVGEDDSLIRASLNRHHGNGGWRFCAGCERETCKRLVSFLANTYTLEGSNNA